ncbi:hypothetical protein NCER_101212 [Vairimorpha ceranae BRL01]|uniref:Phosphatidylinositol N-acetylglucosaminyltransferase n=2 Tax=Vairimorpha ceranae TaxID=40302 RepID=C4V9H1_VAIC1|nr:phosphatidylinositol n-acetylglucosaminyltransferase [Vairimorpha ceranae]EEQ82135.1 hypothetical protein NCER_101212 [Vairimorpha ceranae BRL01]KAF5140689.1 hypothetical protein G9O61_00g011850 [Vairimorpha ceranae]KKO76012.1 phosphatidylinositol n-acetylglucosaminyltransferase [Vairimorpha ceranae]
MNFFAKKCYGFILKTFTYKKYNIDTFYSPTTRAIHTLSLSFLHFIIFYFIKQGDKTNFFSNIEVAIIYITSLNMCNPLIKYKKYCNISKVIFLICFLLGPILHTLTKEICTDTIFFWHSICQIFYVGNSVVFFIYNKKPIRRLYKEDEVLQLEESINIPNPYRPSMVCGNVAVTIGMILLSSRFHNISSVFCFFCISLIYFTTLPNYHEKIKLHKNLVLSMLWIGMVSTLLYFFEKSLFFTLKILVMYMYGVTYLVKCVLKQ